MTKGWSLQLETAKVREESLGVLKVVNTYVGVVIFTGVEEHREMWGRLRQNEAWRCVQSVSMKNTVEPGE